ncbi:hypothetical protein EDF58_102501 [Novosphingobium sp. PhB57]|uniref:hypothetical protein n=1 Tax=Novosphingobium sp. PhB57 TaxID=2485107 RepID=UPI00104FE517|nr:hypothetical protein [Novosphingobium sp. PhB57]TCU59813.1 hypothetical protein EDF58_102501 [Novosphingobium sp. PhB57]
MSKVKMKPASADRPEALSCFTLDPADDGSFKYIRYFYKQDAHRDGITDMVIAKLTPAGHKAAHHDLLLPEAASGEYMDLSYLLQRYDAMLPGSERTGYAQFTLTLPSEQPPHVGWEQVRAWVRSYFVRQERLAALMVLHLPYLAGSSNANHIHVVIPARRLSVNGFTGHARDICSDSGCHDASASWLSFQKEEGSCAK